MIVLAAVALAAFLVFFALHLLHCMHMFQLNGYKPATHRRWMQQNPGQWIPGTVAGSCCLLALLVPPVAAFPVLAAVFALLAVTQCPRKAKKPLVYTARVKRMLVTCAVLVAVLLCLGFLLGSKGGLVLAIGVIAVLSPLTVLVANWLNSPIEKAVQNYYIRDAKKLLQSCPELVRIGVTGSFGKTSVKYILHTLLQAEYDTLMTPESYNTPMGVVITIRKFLRATHRVFVCEMGARHVGDIKELCDIAHPQLGIITSVGKQHLETFHSLDNVKKTKFELADSLPEDGLVFLNGEDENIREHRVHCKIPSVTYGLSPDCDYYATDIAATSRGTSFTVHTPAGEQESFSTKLVGAHNVINIVGAIALCSHLGISLSRLKAQVRKLEAVPHRLQLLRRGSVTVIDDAYNSNPIGARAAIDALALFDGFKILVTPGMVELGQEQDALNSAFGAYAAGVCDYVALVGKKQTQSIYEGLRSAGYPEEKIFVAEDLQQALAAAYAVPADGKEKILLLENDLPDNF
ncbi:MAG: UDP-N-acetylmuramoyl-tripeptide--D-alanyl-D-alanine ligase [Oscillospiraceae bacterium]|nr:UDP-N-acetylmuramoyl-tripeptide--D-alanyl-D-alanine ligase [Oscillospiraceae bacterium]